MKKLTYAQKQAEIAEQRKALDFNWFSELDADVKKRYEFADTIYQLVTDNVYTTNPIPELFDVQPGELGKKIILKRHYGGKVYERTYGEFKRISDWRGKSYTLTTSPKAVHFRVPVEQLKAGAITTSELVDMATKAVLHHKVNLAWKTLKLALPTSDTANTSDTSGALTQSVLNTELQSFKDKYTVNAIFGRENFLFPIVTFTGYDNNSGYPETVKQELHSKGMTSQYMGVPIMTIKEMKNELDSSIAADDGNIWIMSDNAKDWNRYVEVTPLTLTTKVEPEDGTFHLIWDLEDGCAVWRPEFVRRLYNSSNANYA